MSQSDGYRLIEQLGSGLSGVVYLAESATGKVAIRLFQTQEEPLSPGWLLHREYFLQGAHQMATLVNPRIVSLIEVIDEEADAFIAMEYVPGETLALALDRDRFTTERANYLLRNIAVALDYAHHNGVTHGDLKPSNIFLTAQGGAKVGDFAISPRAWSERSGNFPPQWAHPYLAPEAISPPQAPGPAADQYSLAAIASHLHTGQPPATGVLPDGRSASARGLMPSSEAVLARALSRDPRSRYGSCLEFVDALDASFAPPTPVPEQVYGFWSGKRLVYILGGLGLLAVLAIAAALWPSHSQLKAVYIAPPTAHPVVPANSPPTQQPVAVSKPSPMPRLASPAPKQRPPDPPIDQAKFVSPGPDATRLGGAGNAPKPVVDPYPRIREIRPSKSPSDGKLSESVLESSAPTSGDPRGTNLQVYSRNRVIDPGISFSIKDQSLGELALGDLKVAVSVGNPAPKGQLSVEWLLNGLRMDMKPARNGSTVEYGNEPTPGTYRVLLRADKTVLKEFTFRITP